MVQAAGATTSSVHVLDFPGCAFDMGAFTVKDYTSNLTLRCPMLLRFCRIITNTILAVPYHSYSTTYPKTNW